MMVFFHVSFPPNNFESVEGLPRYDLSATLDTISSLWFGLSLGVATRWAIEILFQPQAKDCPLAPALRLNCFYFSSLFVIGLICLIYVKVEELELRTRVVYIRV
jgi:hypothetical protein